MPTPWNEEELQRLFRQAPQFDLPPEVAKRHLEAIRHAPVPRRRKWWRYLADISGVAAVAALILFVIIPKGGEDWQTPAGEEQVQGGVPAPDFREGELLSWDMLPDAYQKLLPPPEAVSHPHAVASDFNGDGVWEFVVSYQESGETRLVFLTPDLGREPYAFFLSDLYEELRQFPVSRLFLADVTGDGGAELFIEQPVGASVGNQLLVFRYLEEEDPEGEKGVGFELLGLLACHRMEMGDYDQDGLPELALWNRDVGDIYAVEVWSYAGNAESDGGYFLPDVEAYPAYFPRVAQYYEKLAEEQPGMRLIWYYLADAYLKSGEEEKAREAVKRGLALEGEYPSDHQFDELLLQPLQ